MPANNNFKKYLIIFSVCILTFTLLTACDPFNRSRKVTVTGTVSEGTGDKLVPDADILLGGTTAQTDNQGSFSITVSPGKYDLLATKQGLGTGKLQDLDLSSVNEKNVQITMLKGGTTSNQPPLINIKNVRPEETISGNLELEVSINTPVDIWQVKVKLSKTGYTADRIVSRKNDFKLDGYRAIKTDFFPNGETTLTVEARDVNNNITKKTIPVNIYNETQETDSQSAPDTPDSFYVDAITMGQPSGNFSIKKTAQNQNTNFYNQQTENLLTDKKPQIYNNLYHNLENLPKETFVYTSIYLPGELPEGALGYRILRSFDGENFELVCDIQQNTYSDTDDRIRPGKPVYYKVQAYNRENFSKPTEPVKVIPLSPVNVKLTEPGEGDSKVTTDPVFSWEPTRDIENIQINDTEYEEIAFYNLIIYKIETERPFDPENEEAESWSNTLLNVTEMRFSELTEDTLSNHTGYRWDINAGFYNVTYSHNGHQVSGYSLFGQDTGSLNGEFNFTTGNK